MATDGTPRPRLNGCRIIAPWLWWLLFAGAILTKRTRAFQPRSSAFRFTRRSNINRSLPVHRQTPPIPVLAVGALHKHTIRRLTSPLRASSEPTHSNRSIFNSNSNRTLLQHASFLLGIASCLGWIALSVVALRYHPDPKFSHCSMNHNILTMSQAFAFPLPVLISAIGTVYHHEPIDTRVSIIVRRLQLGLTATFAYCFASAVFAPAFACGYDLYANPLKAVTGSIFALASILHFVGWKKNGGVGYTSVIQGVNAALWSIAPANNSNTKTKSALFSSATVGLLWFTLQPIVCEYPLMTIPTILGKRLSRAAGAFTFLGAVVSYCLKEASDEEGLFKTPQLKLLRRGLGLGSALHLILVALKLIGVDDGGFLLPGRGLWEVYPAMMAVPFATIASLLVHGVVCMGAFL